jgi:predicted nucleic acid-binding protein
LIVLDSSAVVDLLFRREPESTWVLEQLGAARWRVSAPHLIDAEVLGVVRDRVLRGWISSSDGLDRIRRMTEFPMRRYPHVALLERAWELHPSVQAADALFVALAEALDLPLVTTDRRLARAPGPRVPVLAP